MCSKLVGRMQFDRYKIISQLGQGGMATVYLAQDPRFNRQVALKVLPSGMNNDEMFRARFEREAQTIAALEHPAIVPVYDYGEENNQLFLVMRYMSGGSLADLIGKGPIPLEQAASIIRRIGSALDEAHAQGIIHRDLKPGNILFDHRGNAFLSDFGIVKLTEATTTYTHGAIIGTPAYMSPEQARGDGDLDKRSDVYALGAVLFEMLTGNQPYKADTPMGVAVKHITEPVPEILAVRADLPVDCSTIIGTAMAKNKKERYETAVALATAVDTVAAGQKLPNTQVPPPTVTIPNTEVLPPISENIEPPRRSSWIWLFVGIGLIVILALFYWGSRSFGNVIQPTPTLTVTATASATAVQQATATEIPSATAPTETTPTVELPVTEKPPITKTPSSTPTATPTMTDTPSPTVTETPRPAIIPTPGLISPINGEHKNPVVFTWNSTPGATYQVTVRHPSSGTTYKSGWIAASTWSTDLPAAQYGAWEWFVTTRTGTQSGVATFYFNPVPGAGSGPLPASPTSVPSYP